jgi:uncharacterized Zn finger protein
MTNFRDFGPTIRVEGGLKAQSTRGAIGESWWSKRFLTVLESLAMGGRLSRGRNYARAGQVLSMDIAPGVVTSSVQGSRPKPYAVSIGVKKFDGPTWTRIEAALAEQALFLARLLAGEMPAQIEDVFAAAGAPLFPTSTRDLSMSCSCPDWGMPCKHIAATFYLLAEAFDADPFQILHWRGRDRETLLSNLRALRGDQPAPRKTPAKRSAPAEEPRIGAAAVLSDVGSPDLAETVGRFWVTPVPLPTRPPTLATDVDLILRQLPAPDPALGGPALSEELRRLYDTFRPAPPRPPRADRSDSQENSTI